jgi:cytochrome d ubiquinol oxidase subunit II
MAELWYALLALTLVAYAVLDGFDLGAGALSLFLARNDAERRAVIAAIGPFWDGNEVWLIATGGVLFMAFPSLLAAAFPAFYLALFVVLWCLILRGIAIEVRSHVADAMWRALWDVVFAGSSALLALLFGVALGNLLRGVPISERASFTLAFFSDFRPTGRVGLLDYYTVSVGLLALTALLAHGAAFLAYRTDGPLRERARSLEHKLWLVGGALFALVTVETALLRPELFQALGRRPLGWAFSGLAVWGAVSGARARRQGRDLRGFLGSCAVLGGLLAATATGLYPTLLRSTLDPARNITAAAALSAPYGLSVALAWWPIALALAASYLGFAFRANRERVRADDAPD